MPNCADSSISIRSINARRSRRESLILWKRECSRYASSSRIGYHHNHPSAGRLESRPPSATSNARTLSAGGPHPQQEWQPQRASSAHPPRSASVEKFWLTQDRVDTGSENGIEETRPRSAVPRLGASFHETHGRGVNTSSASGQDSSKNSSQGAGSSATTTIGGEGGSGRRRASSARRPSSSARGEEGDTAFSEEGGDEIYEEIYEDLEEDDGELDNRISIMESRFSTVGREKHGQVGSARFGHGGNYVGVPSTNPDTIEIGNNRPAPQHPRSAYSARPPRAPGAHSAATRRLRSAAPDRTTGKYTTAAGGVDGSPPSVGVGGIRAPRVIKTRPISAPAVWDNLASARRTDPYASLRERRARLELSSATGNRYDLETAAEMSQRENGYDGIPIDVRHQDQQQRNRSTRLPVRDVRIISPRRRKTLISLHYCISDPEYVPLTCVPKVVRVMAVEPGAQNTHRICTRICHLTRSSTVSTARAGCPHDPALAFPPSFVTFDRP